MAIKYKAVEKGQPGVAGGGTKKFYAQIVLNGESTIDDMVKDIEKFSSLSEPDIRGVISALETVIQNTLLDGKIVRLEQVGALYPALSSSGEEKEADLTSSSIREVNVNYRPSDRIKKALGDATFQKVK